MAVVRGISDVLAQPGMEQSPIANDRRPEDNKKFASATASAFAFWLIFKLCKKQTI